ncbi:MAG: flagellar biosynthetic protein FliQ [Phycisphaerae bacterium SM23_33]|nr:MAG: flagellar biosynthetic protein FliQ [Phycisphaerae bacterium SM23_33]
MSNDFVLHLGRRALETALLLSGPVLLVTLVVGLITSMFQAVTSIRDMTMGLVVKLVFVGLTLLVCGGWMLQIAVGFATEMFNHMQTVGR